MTRLSSNLLFFGACAATLLTGSWAFAQSVGEESDFWCTQGCASLPEAQSAQWCQAKCAGAVEAKGALKGGARDGLWTLTYKDDASVAGKGKYKNGKKDGLWVYRYKGSKKGAGRSAAGSYKDGKRRGEWTEWAPNNQKLWTWAYDKSRPLAAVSFYDKKGRRSRIFTLKGSNVDSPKERWVRDGEYRRNKDGKLHTKGTFKDGARTGNWTWFYPDGKVMAEAVYKNNKRVGAFVKYFPGGKGKVKCKGKFQIDGKGVVLCAHPNKKRDYAMSFAFDDSVDDGVARQGAFKRWYDSGKLAQEGTYDKDLKSGTWTTYHKFSDNLKHDRIPMERGAYKDGKRVGIWQFWRSSGAKLKRIKYTERGDKVWEKPWRD